MLTTIKVYQCVLCSQNLQKQTKKFFASGAHAALDLTLLYVVVLPILQCIC